MAATCKKHCSRHPNVKLRACMWNWPSRTGAFDCPPRPWVWHHHLGRFKKRQEASKTIHFSAQCQPLGANVVEDYGTCICQQALGRNRILWLLLLHSLLPMSTWHAEHTLSWLHSSYIKPIHKCKEPGQPPKTPEIHQKGKITILGPMRSKKSGNWSTQSGSGSWAGEKAIRLSGPSPERVQSLGREGMPNMPARFFLKKQALQPGIWDKNTK